MEPLLKAGWDEAKTYRCACHFSSSWHCLAFLQFWRSWKDVIPLDPCNLMEQPFTGGTKDIESHRFSL